MSLCRDQNRIRNPKLGKVREHSTLAICKKLFLALVHFALNKKSINILIEKKVLDLFDLLGADINMKFCKITRLG